MSEIQIMRDEKKKLAIELFARDANIKQTEIARQLNVSDAAVSKWMKEPEFIDAIYDKFMVLAGRHLPGVVMALINEAKEGNIRAAELVLKHVNKLQDRVHIEINAPFMQFMNNSKIDQAEIVPDDAVLVGENVEIKDNIELPPRNPKANSRKNPKNSLNIKDYRKPRVKPKKKSQGYKKDRYLNDINSRYKIRKRAKAVGLDLMPSGKPQPHERKAWKKKLIELEKAQDLWYPDHDE